MKKTNLLVFNMLFAIILILNLSTVSTAVNYADGRFVKNEKAQMFFANKLKKIDEEIIKDKILYSIMVGDNDTIAYINLNVPFQNNKTGTYLGEIGFKMVPTEKISITNIIKLLCYENYFDGTKFICNLSYGTLGRVMKRQYSEFKNINENTLNNFPKDFLIMYTGELICDPHFDNLHFFEIIPGEKVLVQVFYTDDK